MVGITMKYFKNLDGEIFGIDTDQDHLIKDEWVSCPEPVPVVDTLALLKSDRESKLASMVFTTSNGSVIQCREQDEQRIRTAIDLMTRNSLAEYPWYAADNSVTTVTIADLENAIISGQEQGATIWATFFASI